MQELVSNKLELYAKYFGINIKTLNDYLAVTVGSGGK